MSSNTKLSSQKHGKGMFVFMFLWLFSVSGIIVLLHNPNALELEVTNWRPDILLQDVLIECRIHGSINYEKSYRSWSCKAASDHHTTTTMFECWCSFYEMLCWFYARFNGTHTFQNVKLLFHRSTEYLHKSLGDNQYIFVANVRRAFLYFLVSNGFWLGNLPWIPFLPSLFLIVESWTLTLTEASEACSSGFFYESSLRSWSNFGRPASPGKVHHCSKFSPFMDNGSVHGSLDSQSFRNGSVALFRLIHINYFVSHLFLNFFRSRHDVLLFKHASLWLVLFKWFLDSTGLSVIRPGCG